MEAPFRRAFDAALNPLAARNALGIEEGGGTGGAPTDAQYIVAADDPTLTNDRVLTNTATVTWDFTTAGQAKANAATGGGTPGGSNTQVQFNDGGAFGGTADLTWNKSSVPKLLTVTGNVSVTGATGNSLQAAGAIQGSLFRCAGTIAVFGTELTSGVVNIRPNTISNATGQLQVQSSGAVIAAGPITLPSNPTANLHAATKQYVDLFAPLASPTFTGDPKAPTPTAGDNDTSIATTAFVVAAIAAIPSASATPPQCGRLDFVTTTSLKFAPYNGDSIKINGALFSIPSAGIAGLGSVTGVFINGVAGQNLLSDTTYLVCAFNNAGTITADFRTTLTHAPSTTAGNVGVEIPTGLDSRSVIGLIRTITGPVFASQATSRLVLSWFNRRNLAAVGAITGNITTNSSTLVELATISRVNFCTWGDEAVIFGLSGAIRNNAVNANTAADIGLDGASTTVLGTNLLHDQAVAGYFVPGGAGSTLTIAEGFHFITPLGRQSGGTGLFQLANTATVRG